MNFKIFIFIVVNISNVHAYDNSGYDNYTNNERNDF